VASLSHAATPQIPGFSVEVYADGAGAPTSLAFAPGGRLFVGDKGGAIRIVENGVVHPAPFATISVNATGESGLLALAISPNFATDHFLYIFATVSSSEQRIIRLRDDNGVGVDETTILGNLPTNGFRHNGGGLGFGPDGMLYFSIGDNVLPDESQSLASLIGKLSRIRPDGTVPDDNPFDNADGSPSAVYAYGFRNPFRFGFAPDGRMYLTDVGSSADPRREEINKIEAGANYGWPQAEGIANMAGLTDPIFAYSDQGRAPTAIVCYSGNHFSEEFQGDLFHIEYQSNGIYRTVVNENDDVVSFELFVEAENGPVDMVQGPDGALYYGELDSGRIMRVRFGDDASGLLPTNGAGDDNGGGNTPEMTNCVLGLPFFSLMAVIAMVGIGVRRVRK
jgi:glucose/arabinose dehydrogenase